MGPTLGPTGHKTRLMEISIWVGPRYQLWDQYDAPNPLIHSTRVFAVVYLKEKKKNDPQYNGPVQVTIS